MDWKEAREDERRVLKRIVALLFAFAALAERLYDLPRPASGLVVWVLRFAETIARDFVMDMALENGVAVTPAFLGALHRGDTSADAMQLAENFRALAVLLDRLANSNPGCREIGIRKLCVKLAACSAGLSAETRFGRGLRLGPLHAVGPRDTS